MSNIHSDLEENTTNLSHNPIKENSNNTQESSSFQQQKETTFSNEEELSEAIMQEVIRENSLIDSLESQLQQDNLGQLDEKHHNYISEEVIETEQAIKQASMPEWALERNQNPVPREFSASSTSEFYDPDFTASHTKHPSLDDQNSSDTILHGSMFPTEQHHEIKHAETGQAPEHLQNEAFERWLNKPIPEKSDNANTMRTVIAVTSIALLAIISAGVYFTGMFGIYGPKVSSLVELSSNEFNLNTASYNQTTEAINSNTNDATSFSSQSGNLPGGSNSNKAVKTAAASFAIAPTLGKPITNCKPDIQMEALDGGLSKITILSECHRGEDVKLTYADVNFVRNIDSEGKAIFVLDGFAGNKVPVEFLFNDGQQFTKIPALKDIENLTKIAVLWTSKHDIDLHAFEYTASQNSLGHLWDGNKSSHTKASEKVKSSGKGHGFISSSHNVTKYPNQKLEVYTFIHAPQQTGAVVKLGLSYKKVDERPTLKKANCNSTSSETLNYQTLQLVRNGTLSRTQGAFVIDSCSPLTQKQIRSNAIQDLEISN